MKDCIICWTYVTLWMIILMFDSGIYAATFYNKNKKGTDVWHDKKVNYMYTGCKFRHRVEKVIEDINGVTCIKFKEMEFNKAVLQYIDFDRNHLAVYNVPEQVMNQVKECPRRSTTVYTVYRSEIEIYHSIMHALGFIHDEMLSGGDDNNGESSAYDISSIMHAYRGLPCERQDYGSQDELDLQYHMCEALSHYDVLSLNEAYECEERIQACKIEPTCYIKKKCICVCPKYFSGNACEDIQKQDENGCTITHKELEPGESFLIDKKATKDDPNCSIRIFTARAGTMINISSPWNREFKNYDEVVIEFGKEPSIIFWQKSIFSDFDEEDFEFLTRECGPKIKPFATFHFNSASASSYQYTITSMSVEQSKRWCNFDDTGGNGEGTSNTDGKGEGTSNTDGHGKGTSTSTNGQEEKFIHQTFETESSFGGFTQTGSLKWRTTKATTPATHGHESTANGNSYAYMDTTDTSLTAILTTDDIFNGTKDVCINFAYLISGENVGKLKVLSKDTFNLNTEKSIWTTSNMIPSWKTVSLTIKADIDVNEPYNILFEATSSGGLGIIGIDDLLIGRAPCTIIHVGTDCQACEPTLGECHIANKSLCEDLTAVTKFSVVDALTSPSTCTISTTEDASGGEKHTRTCSLSPCQFQKEETKTILFTSECGKSDGSECKVCCIPDSECTTPSEDAHDTDDRADIVRFSDVLICVFTLLLIVRMLETII